MICAIVYQLTRNLTPEEIQKGGFASYYVDHTTGIYPVDASGVPFNVATLQSTGDVITDLHEDLAAEQKARTTYENILRLVDDPDVRDAIKFLREREIVHFQRFGEANHTDLSKRQPSELLFWRLSFANHVILGSKSFGTPSSLLLQQDAESRHLSDIRKKFSRQDRSRSDNEQAHAVLCVGRVLVHHTRRQHIHQHQRNSVWYLHVADFMKKTGDCTSRVNYLLYFPYMLLKFCAIFYASVPSCFLRLT